MSGLPYPEHLRVFPHRGAIDHGVRLAAGQAVAADGFFTFDTLFAAFPLPAGRRYARPLVTKLLARTVLASVDASRAQDVRAVHSLWRALRELRAAGITPQHFATGGISRELQRLVLLLGRYEEALASAGLCDDADREREAVLAVAQGRLPALFKGARQLTVEGGASLFGARLDLLRAFAGRGVAVRVRVPYDVERRGAFAWPEASLHRIEASETGRFDVLYDNRVGSGPLGEARRAQFSNRTTAQAPLRVLEAGSAGDHAALAASQVAVWLKAGVPAHNIAVVTPDLSGQGGDIARELNLAGIGSRLRGASLMSTGPSRALLLALTLPDQGVPREGLLELWRELGRWVDGPKGRLSPEAVASELLQAGVRSARVGGYRAALLRRAESQSLRHDDAEPRALAIADAIDELLHGLRAVPSRAGLDDLATAALTLWRVLNLGRPPVSREPWPQRLEVDRPLLAAEAAYAQAVEGITELVTELMQAAREVPRFVASRGELADWLRLELEERTQNAGAARLGGVDVLAPAALVETRYSHVLLVGVDPETFPRPVPVDTTLTDELRGEINRLLGPRLLQYGALTGRATLRGEARDLWLWLEILAACQEELVVTYTRPEGKVEHGRSELVQELLRSLGSEPVLAGPAYASEQAPSLRRLRQRYVHAHFAAGARAVEPLVRSRSAALGALVAADASLVNLGQRVSQEAQLQSAVRRVALLGEAERALVERHWLDKTHSVSRIDQLGTCSFRYFAQELLRLEREDLGTLGADARDEGTAAHTALEFVYADIIAQGGLAQARQNPAAAVARARALVMSRGEQILRRVSVHPFLQAATLEAACAAVETQLWFDLGADDGVEPIAVEHQFGKQHPSPVLEVPEPGGERSLKIRGSIDRIDRGGTAVMALDYKRRPKARPDGRHFQLPLYLLVAQRDFAPGATSVDAAWVSLRDAKRRAAMSVGQDPASYAAQVAEQLWGRVGRLLEGDVSPDPDPVQSCNACDFAALCRHRAVRLSEEEAP